MATIVAIAATMSFVGTALAAEFHSEVEKSFVTTTMIEQVVMNTPAGSPKCKSTKLTGEVLGKKQGSQNFASPTLSLTPSFEECTFIGLEEPVINEGCKFQLQQPQGSGPGYSGNLNVVCAEGKTITFHPPGFGGCVIRLGSQSGKAFFNYADQGATGSRTVRATINLSGLETRGSGGACGGESTTGTMKGVIDIKAYSDPAFTKQVGFWVQ